MPDIDMDFADNRRDEIIEYAKETCVNSNAEVRDITELILKKLSTKETLQMLLSKKNVVIMQIKSTPLEQLKVL